MAIEHVLGVLGANWYMNRKERKEQERYARQLRAQRVYDSVQAAEEQRILQSEYESYRHSNGSSSATAYAWQNDYVDNPAGVDPYAFDKLSDFLPVYNSELANCKTSMSNNVREILSSSNADELVTNAATVMIVGRKMLENNLAQRKLFMNCFVAEISRFNLTLEEVQQAAGPIKQTVEESINNQQ